MPMRLLHVVNKQGVLYFMDIDMDVMWLGTWSELCGCVNLCG